MSLAYYTMDDLRLGRGGFLQKGWTIRQRPELVFMEQSIICLP